MTEPRMLGGSSVTRLMSSTSIFMDSRRYWARFRADTPGPRCACAPIDGHGIALTVSPGREVEQTQSVCAVVQRSVACGTQCWFFGFPLSMDSHTRCPVHAFFCEHTYHTLRKQLLLWRLRGRVDTGHARRKHEQGVVIPKQGGGSDQLVLGPTRGTNRDPRIRRAPCTHMAPLYIVGGLTK